MWKMEPQMVNYMYVFKVLPGCTDSLIVKTKQLHCCSDENIGSTKINYFLLMKSAVSKAGF